MPLRRVLLAALLFATPVRAAVGVTEAIAVAAYDALFPSDSRSP